MVSITSINSISITDTKRIDLSIRFGKKSKYLKLEKILISKNFILRKI